MMDTDRNLLVAAISLQLGLIEARQFHEVCERIRERPDIPIENLLIERRWLRPPDRPHVEYLTQRALDRHSGDGNAALEAIREILGEALSVLACRDDEQTLPGSSRQPLLRNVKPVATSVLLGARYHFVGLHATGGVGQIWRTHDRQMDREVALKGLRPDTAGDATVAARFIREARLTGQLEHPGIVPVYELDVGDESQQPFYTMRLVRGKTLSSAIADFHLRRAEGKEEPLLLSSLLTAFAAVCNTIAYAHSRGVLHRDLKGSNVMLGDFGEVIVLDWGLAKLMNENEEEDESLRVQRGVTLDPNLTIQGDVVGTPAYMAPEQAVGRSKDIDQRTDIYGLGAILYEILTGQPLIADRTRWKS